MGAAERAGGDAGNGGGGQGAAGGAGPTADQQVRRLKAELQQTEHQGQAQGDFMDLPDLSSVSGTDLSEEQLRGILAQVDLDVTNLLRDGKLSALRYGLPGDQGALTDRAANLRALLETRRHYQSLLESRPAWVTTQARCG